MARTIVRYMSTFVRYISRRLTTLDELPPQIIEGLVRCWRQSSCWVIHGKHPCPYGHSQKHCHLLVHPGVRHLPSLAHQHKHKNDYPTRNQWISLPSLGVRQLTRKINTTTAISAKFESGAKKMWPWNDQQKWSRNHTKTTWKWLADDLKITQKWPMTLNLSHKLLWLVNVWLWPLSYGWL